MKPPIALICGKCALTVPFNDADFKKYQIDKGEHEYVFTAECYCKLLYKLIITEIIKEGVSNDTGTKQ